MSRNLAVEEHVAVLERAGLIQERANGREQLVCTTRARLQRVGNWLLTLDGFRNGLVQGA